MLVHAFILVIVSALLHATWNFTTKKVSGNLSVLYLGLVIASLFLFPFALIFLLLNGLEPIGYLFVGATGVVHAFYFLFLSRAYTHGSISVVYPVARGCGVVGTAAVALLLLCERVSMIGAAGIFCTGMGILFIGLSRSAHLDGRRALLYALLVGLTMIAYSIIDKMAVAYVHPVFYILGLFMLSMLFLTPYVLATRRDELVQAWREYKKYSVIIGLGSAVGYLLILFVFQIARVSYVVAVREVSVAIGAVLGMVYLGETRSRWKLLGIGLITAGLILIRIA
jgi:drug/metabolite transporter (DMT)-like permease